MNVEKSINTSITLLPHEYMAGDVIRTILDKLKEQYEGKCFSGCLIKKILSVDQMGSVIMSTRHQDGTAFCDIRFKAIGFVYSKYDILYNCIVQNIEKNGSIVCKNENAAIKIRGHAALSKISKGDVILARVGVCKYNINQPRISVNAYPFIPIAQKPMKFTIRPKKSACIAALQKKYNALVRGDKSDAKCKNYFSILLYPLTKVPKIKTVPLESVFDHKIVTISQPYWAEGDIVIHPEKTNEQDSDNTLKYMFEQKIQREQMLQKLCKFYPTMKDIRANDAMWMIYQKNRK